MSDDSIGCGVGLFLGLLIGAIATFNICQWEWRDACIKQDVAEWTIDQEGNREFRWKGAADE